LDDPLPEDAQTTPEQINAAASTAKSTANTAHTQAVKTLIHLDTLSKTDNSAPMVEQANSHADKAVALALEAINVNPTSAQTANNAKLLAVKAKAHADAASAQQEYADAVVKSDLIKAEQNSFRVSVVAQTRDIFDNYLAMLGVLQEASAPEQPKDGPALNHLKPDQLDFGL
jgi:hypothetical protein